MGTGNIRLEISDIRRSIYIDTGNIRLGISDIRLFRDGKTGLVVDSNKSPDCHRSTRDGVAAFGACHGFEIKYRKYLQQ